MFAPGDRLGRFAVETTVSADAQADTVVVRDERAGTSGLMTALTVDISAEIDVREHFWQTVRRLRTLQHARVLPVQDAGLDAGRLWLVTEPVGGQPLAALVGRGAALGSRRPVALVSDVADALDAAHAHGLLHLDLRPSQIWVSRPGTGEHAYLTGFATSRTHMVARQLATTGRFPTTLIYTAPEHLAGEEVGPAADQYSLACLLFECLTGRPPYVRAHALALINAHLHDEPPAVSELNAELPPSLDLVLVRGLAKSAADRFPDCSTLVAATRAALTASGVALRTQPVEPQRSLAVVGGPASGLRLPLDEGKRRLGRGGTADLVVADPFMSRVHVLLDVGPTRVDVADAGSTNGTVLNGRPLNGVHELAPGQLFEAGSTVFRLDDTAQSAEPAGLPLAAGADAVAVLDAARSGGGVASSNRDTLAAMRLRLGYRSGAATPDGRPEPLMADLSRAGVIGVRAPS